MKEVNICITGAAGNIGYAIAYRICSGEVFGHNTSIQLHLLERPETEGPLRALEMELLDCAFPLLKSITCHTNNFSAFNDIDWAIMIGAFPRKNGMERKDLLNLNSNIFIDQGRAINENAKVTCKCIVVGNPCNTNAFVLKSTFSRINPRNVFSMTYLDENRAVSQLAQKQNVSTNDIENMIVWGNHSSTMYPNFYEATLNGKKITDFIDENWLKTEFLKKIQQRGAEIIKHRGSSSSASAANAAIDTIKALIYPTPNGKYFSCGVLSDGSYGIEKDIIFSFPISYNGEDWSILQGIELNHFSKEKIKLSEKELIEERDIFLSK